MADRVDTESDRMQPTHRKPVIYSVLSNPTFQQLPPGDHSMLLPRQFRNERISIPAKPPQPVYIPG